MSLAWRSRRLTQSCSQEAGERHGDPSLKKSWTLGREVALGPDTETAPGEQHIKEISQSRAGRRAVTQDEAGGSNRGVGVVSPMEKSKARAAMLTAAGPAKPAVTGGDLVPLGCHHSAAHLRNAALGLGACLRAAFSNPMPVGICTRLKADNCFVFNKVPFNTSQGSLALFQATFCLF